MRLAKAQPCLSQKQNRASREREKTKNKFFSVSERHDRASRESTTVPLAEAKPCLSRKEKKEKYFFSISERHGPLAKAQPCLSRKKKKQKTRFFPFPRGTVVTLAKAKPCLSQKQNHDSRERKKIAQFFSDFFY